MKEYISLIIEYDDTQVSTTATNEVIKSNYDALITAMRSVLLVLNKTPSESDITIMEVGIVNVPDDKNLKTG